MLFYLKKYEIHNAYLNQEIQSCLTIVLSFFEYWGTLLPFHELLLNVVGLLFKYALWGSYGGFC